MAIAPVAASRLHAIFSGRIGPCQDSMGALLTATRSNGTFHAAQGLAWLRESLRYFCSGLLFGCQTWLLDWRDVFAG